MRDAWRHFAAEFIGMFAFVFVGSAAIMSARMSQSPAALVEIALAHGLTMAVMVSATMRISGHINPAVTLGLLVTRRIEPMMAALYIVAQILGAIAAGYALKATFPEAVFVATRGGGQSIALDITGGQAFLLEAIATFFLVFVIFGTVVDLRGPKIGGLAIGFVIAADILAIGPLTGASMNPARSFGPAVASGVYEAQLLYWFAPITGAVVAALLYEFLFMRRGREPVDHGELRP
ncbi:MAG TPA: aquaporin [Gemmatimonadetes bacterium]|jgi:MIP family channel proteins|nr:aquaporin [Gemmatimonadota bacterium]